MLLEAEINKYCPGGYEFGAISNLITWVRMKYLATDISVRMEYVGTKIIVKMELGPTAKVDHAGTD